MMAAGIFSPQIIVMLFLTISRGQQHKEDVQMCLKTVCSLADHEGTCGTKCRCNAISGTPSNRGEGVCGDAGDGYQHTPSASSPYVRGMQGTGESLDGGGNGALHGHGAQETHPSIHGPNMQGPFHSSYTAGIPGEAESIYEADYTGTSPTPYGPGAQRFPPSTHGLGAQALPQAPYGGGGLQGLSYGYYGGSGQGFNGGVMPGTYGGGYGGGQGQLANAILGGVRTVGYGVTNVLQQRAYLRHMRDSTQPTYDAHISTPSFSEPSSLSETPDNPPPPPPRSTSLGNTASKRPPLPIPGGSPSLPMRPPPPPPRLDSLQRPPHKAPLLRPPPKANLPSAPSKPLPPIPKDRRWLPIIKKPHFPFPKLPKVTLTKPKIPSIRFPRLFKKG